MNKNGKGGAKTNNNGKPFEKKVTNKIIKKLNLKLEIGKYQNKDFHWYADPKKEILLFEQRNFYKWYQLNWERKIPLEKKVSKKFFPDLILIIKNDVYVIEIKYQETSGSTDEKINAGFVLREIYKEYIFKDSGYKFQNFCFLTNDWFKQERYKTSIEILNKYGINLYVNEIDWNTFIRQ